jgi:hypothetical protein
LSKKTKRRVRTGLAGLTGDLLTNWTKSSYYFREELDKKQYVEVLKPYIINEFGEDADAIMILEDWKWGMYASWAAAAYWITNGLDITDEVVSIRDYMNNALKGLIPEGKVLLLEKNQERAKVNANKPSPHDALREKVNRTVMVDYDDMVDRWMSGIEEEIDLYQLFQKHELSGKATSFVKQEIDYELSGYSDALDKSCEQAIENYNHLTKKELNRRVKVLNNMLADLERIKAQSIMNRARKKTKAKDPAKQITKLQYKRNDKEYKLESVNPILIVGSNRVYTFNTSTRQLNIFITNSRSGIQVTGTTFKNVDVEKSVCVKLRKPDEVLPVVLGNADKTIDKTVNLLPAKKSLPRTRINNHHIILRAI